MTRPPLSPAQAAAVHCEFADALVTAGAGSGKTRVLSERFVHLVREGHVPLRRLAALTFTDKAAAQMRQRIGDLFRELEEDARGTEAALALSALRADVEFAPISTIHAFCALLLRQHAVEAQVDPAFKVMDAVEADLLEDDAATLAEQRLARDHPDLIEVLHVLPGDARDVLLGFLRRLRGAGCAIEDLTWTSGQSDVGAAVALVQELSEDFAKVGDHLPEERQHVHVEAMLRIGETLAKVRDDEDTSPFLAAQAAATMKSLTGPKARAYSSPRKALQEALEALSAALLDAWGARVLLPMLKKVLVLYADAYQALKDEQSALDFTDLELRARDLLRTAAADGEALDLAPYALLVDEFQDTNPLQAEITAALRTTPRPATSRGGAAPGAPQFSVGDAKQSIYRFRRADVGVILEERARIGETGVHPMHASYRSCPPLVATINALHGRMFAGGAAGVPYEPLEAAGTFCPVDGPVVDVAIIDVGKSLAADVARPLEAAWIAASIHNLVEGKTERLAVQRKNGASTGKSAGPLRYGDIAILFRAGTSIPIYEAALEALGIPFLTQKSKGFFQAEEITDLVHVLRVVHNPGDRYALACAVTGPAMGATDEELLRWFGRDPDEQDKRTPWERIVDDAEAGGRHAETVATLKALRLEAAGGSLATAVERALVDLGLYETALLRPVGDRAAANLRKAIELARRLDAGGRRGLGDLLRHLATLREREMGESDAPIGGEAEDVVRLTTAHGAKGLEYPVVYVADIGRGSNNGPDPIQFDGGQGIAARVKDPLEGVTCTPAGFSAIVDQDKREQAQEELRLLYVAMTRAEERLILTGWCKGATKGRPSRFGGWGAALWNALADAAAGGLAFEHGERVLTLPASDDDGSGTGDVGAQVRFALVDGLAIDAPSAPVAVTEIPAVSASARSEAEALLARAAEPVAPLGNTRFVVSVSELLTFAASPQRYYHERIVLAGAQAATSAAWDAPGHDLGSDGVDDDALAEASARREARLEVWDEPAETHAGLDRAAVGRAAHGVIERLRAGDVDVPALALEAAVAAEASGLAEEGVTSFAAAVEELAARYIRSPVGTAMRAALTEGSDVRREVALHARIRFPGGAPVGGFDSLLVKGSIDLWLPTPDGVLIIDHKTNRRGGAFRTPEALAEHYAWQLRLYALAAERALGAGVAGAQLLLLDPSWGPEAVVVPVDVTGDALEETRRLCRAFAFAELEGRYPETWEALLEGR